MNFKMIVRRFFAFLIDWNIMLGFALVLMYYGPGSSPDYYYYPSIEMFSSLGFILGLFWIPFYCFFKDCLFGRRSLGKLIFGLKIQNNETGTKPSYRSLIARNVTFFIAQVECVVVLANKGRRLGDLIGKTKVVSRKENKELDFWIE